MVLVTLFCLVLQIGVRIGAAADNAPFCDVHPLIVPGQSIGTLSVGMPADDAHALLHVPGAEETIDGYGSGAYARRTISYRSGPNRGWMQIATGGILIRLVLLGDGHEPLAHCHTAKGIHVGSPLADVRAAYGRPPMRQMISGPYTVWIYDKLGINFYFFKALHYDQVGGIEVYALGEVLF